MIRSKVWVASLSLVALLLNAAAYPVFAAETYSPAVITSSMPVNLNVPRINGVDRYETAARIAQAGWQGTSDYVVLAAGMDANLVDALAAAPLAKYKNAPILLTEGDKLNSYAEGELKRLQTKTVYVTSGSAVIQENVLNALKAMGLQVIPLGGKDRFETSINIANQLPTPSGVVVTTAWQNADALAIASIAAKRGMPILLTDPNQLPQNVANYIQNAKGKTYVLGKEGAVSEAVKNALPGSVRIGGDDRYGTSLEILKTFADDLHYSQGYIANGEDDHLVDALAGAPLAALTSSAILLANQTPSSEVANYLKITLSPNETVLGGQGTLSDEVYGQLMTTTSLTQDGSTQGSSDPVKPLNFETLRISASNLTLRNTTVTKSLYLQGQNLSLNNVKVEGTLFISSAQAGSINVQDVKATNIVILSGPQEGITLKAVTAQTLRVQPDAMTFIRADTGTAITNTCVNTTAQLSAQAGSFGAVTVQTDNAQGMVTFSGKFTLINVNTPSNIQLGSDATVDKLNSGANFALNVAKTAQVKELSNPGYSIATSGEGAINLPSATVPAGGGGAVGGGATSFTIANAITGMSLNVKDVKTLPFALGSQECTVNLANQGLKDSDVIDGINLTVSRDLTLNIDKTLLTPAVSKDLSIGQNKLTLSDIGMPDQGDSGVSYSTLKSYLIFKNSIKGQLVDKKTQVSIPITFKISI